MRRIGSPRLPRTDDKSGDASPSATSGPKQSPNQIAHRRASSAFRSQPRLRASPCGTLAARGSSSGYAVVLAPAHNGLRPGHSIPFRFRGHGRATGFGLVMVRAKRDVAVAGEPSARRSPCSAATRDLNYGTPCMRASPSPRLIASRPTDDGLSRPFVRWFRSLGHTQRRTSMTEIERTMPFSYYFPCFLVTIEVVHTRRSLFEFELCMCRFTIISITTFAQPSGCADSSKDSDFLFWAH